MAAIYIGDARAARARDRLSTSQVRYVGSVESTYSACSSYAWEAYVANASQLALQDRSAVVGVRVDLRAASTVHVVDSTRVDLRRPTCERGDMSCTPT